MGALDQVLGTYLAASKRIVLALSIAVLAGMVAINGLEIGGRALFQKSFGWVQEVSIVGAMWVYFFAYALIAKDEEYIRVDLFVSFAGARLQRAIGVLARLLTIGFHATVAWFALETWKFLGLFRTSVLDWPESLFVLPILIGAVDILITELIHLRRQLTRPTGEAR